MTDRSLVLGPHRLELGVRTYVVGIVNATPDSFYDRGRWFDPHDSGPAIARAEQLLDEGADLVDVGGETAQPSSPALDPVEEIRRVVPVIRALATRTTRPISADTYKLEVARAAIEAGACLINDTTGLADERLAALAAETGAGLVIMHIPHHPKLRLYPGYPDPIGAVAAFLRGKATIAERAGVPPERIVVDPGIGFGKTALENLTLTAGLGRFQELGHALLYACSRRTFLGDLLGGQPPEARLEATCAVNATAILRGADLIRVHDVGFFAKLVRVLDRLKALPA